MNLRGTGTVVAFGLAALFASQAVAQSPPPRSRESFNAGWRFARFGLQPDGSRLPEPGAPRWTILARASSEEADKGNTAAAALDGDPKSRWCATSARKDEWLAVDLAGAPGVAALEIDWEFPDLTYGYAVETSPDAREWKPIAARTGTGSVRHAIPTGSRHLRIRVASPPDGKWASIREVRLMTADGAPIVNSQTTGGEPPQVVAFDDSGWRSLDVPHDWGIEGPFRDDLPNDTGKLPWKAIGWYRKTFHVDPADAGRRVFLDFDGAMAGSRVYLNGRYAGGWPYGYQSFRVDLTPHLKPGEQNLVAVRLDTESWGSRWYPGAGIYRNVWLMKTPTVHIAHHGVFVTTPELTDESGRVDLAVAIDNREPEPIAATVRAEIYELDGDGKPGAKVADAPAAAIGRIQPASAGSFRVSTVIQHPKRWSLTSPARYLARVIVERDGRTVDAYDQPLGFRTIEFTRDGFFLNGEKTFLKGTCNHHDLGSLGSALNVRALERQLEILKEMGCNALRTSHNPPAPELLDLADRMGFVVQVEAFDCWRSGKTAGDYSSLFEEWYARDLQAMVHRDRNHPSVVMWSIGNEIIEQDGPWLAKPLADVVRAEDPTRPVSAGCHHPQAGTNGFQTAVDAFGLNYHLEAYSKISDFPANKDKPIYTSESSSCVSSRGEYFFPVKRGKDSQVDFQVSSYDVDAPPWAQSPDEVFEALDRHPNFFGEFVWTGFDYIGEPTPYNNDSTNLLNFSDPARREAMKADLDRLGSMRVPSASSYFGIVDLCGFKKDRFFLYQSRWRPDLASAHILPHWNWPERVGQVTPVHVYTSGDEGELFLNGASLGRRKKGPFQYRLRWDDVTYRPGELKVVTYKDGREWATDVMKTAGPAAALTLSADRPEIRADGLDLSFLTVTLTDAEGVMVPRSHNLVEFAVEGPGEIVAVGNGNAASHEPFQASQRRIYNGLAQVVVRVKPGQTGKVVVTAASDGLKPARAEIVGR